MTTGTGRPASYLERLQGELAEIRAAFGDIIRGSTIRYVNPNTSDSPIFFAGAADWGWGPSDAPSTVARMVLLQRYRDWFVRLKLLFRHPTPEVETKLNETNDFVESWLVRDDSWDWNIPQTVEKAEAVGKTRLAAFDDLLELAGHTPETTNLRVVPDTSALMRNPDMASYQRALGTEPFTVHLVPPVLAELDDLKDRGKTQDVRDKAHAVDRRVKGLRDKGQLGLGVNLTKSVIVKLEAKEVDARAVLDWLDPTVPDDRLIACALRLQSDHPVCCVVLITSDLNLQTKAEAAGLPYIETPPSTESLQAKLTARIIPGVPHKRSARVELRNVGAATAKNITYSLEPPDDVVGTRLTAGPWHEDTLKPGQAAEPQILMLYHDPSVLRAEWTDGTGTRTCSAPLDDDS